MYKKFLLVVTMAPVLAGLAVGCGGRESTVSGVYVFVANPKYYVEFRRDQTFAFRCTQDTPAYDWPLGVQMYPSSGVWRLNNGSQIALRSEGSEMPFGEIRDKEIVDIIGSIWRKK